VILTADHSTGGLTIGANGIYQWNPEILRTMESSPVAIAEQISEKIITQNLLTKLLKFKVTEKEVNIIQLAKNTAIDKLSAYKQLDKKEKSKTKKPMMSKIIASSIKTIIDVRTNTGWTSGGHTAIDVPVHTLGKNSEKFKGKIDNTDIAKQIFLLLGKS